jgi:uncharacterized protein (DUF934 family)
MALLNLRNEPPSSVTPVGLADLPAAAQTNQSLAVTLEAGDDARALAPYLDRLALVVLAFPKFRDGRNYSAARILRDHLHYKGEIRAAGDVLADQLHFMRRCGIDCFELADNVDLATAKQALARYDAVYQVASDARTPIWKQRIVGSAS